MEQIIQERLKQIYDKIDKDKSGSINISELTDVCNDLQIKLTKDDIDYFYKLDKDNTQTLDKQEFSEFVISKLKIVFDSMDLDGNGTLSVDEIDVALKKIDIKLEKREIKALVSQIDIDKDGTIDFQEFCAFFSKIPSPSFKNVIKAWTGSLSLDIGSDQIPAAIPPPEIPLYQYMLAGGLGGIVSKSFTAPLEKIKIMAQTQGDIRIRETFMKIFREEGIKSLFAGNATNCVRIFPTGALVCLVYANMIKYTPVDNQKNPNQPLWRLFSGASAGVIAASLTQPLDVVRAKLTVQQKGGKYKGIIGSLKMINGESGTRGLFKGLTPTLITIAPFLAVQQTTYDMVRSYTKELNIPPVPLFFTAGCIAGGFAQTIVHPLDVFRRYIQIHSKQRRDETSLVKELVLKGGVKRCYSGLTAAWIKVMPSAALSLIVRDYILGRIK